MSPQPSARPDNPVGHTPGAGISPAASAIQPFTPDGEALSFKQLIRMAPGTLGVAVVLAILSAVFSILPFWLLYRVLEQLLAPVADIRTVWFNLGGMLVLLALRWALMAASHMLAHKGAFTAQHQLRLALARRLGEVPLSFFANRGSGSLRRTLSDDVNALEGFLAHMLPDAAAAAAAPLAALALLFAVDWRLSLAALAPLPLAVLAQAWMMRRAGERMAEWSALQKRIANHVGEYVRGVHVVKSFGLSSRSFAELADAVRGAAYWVADYSRSSSTGWVMFTGLLAANIAVVAPVGAWLLLAGSISMPVYLLFLLVTPSVLLPLLRLTFAMGEQMQRAEALARIAAILRAPALADTSRDATLPGPPLALAFHDVRHRYGTRLALDGISFTAPAGGLTALVGPSGSGKSTVARLLPRLYEYESGQIQVGGLGIRDWPLDELLARIAIVFQEVYLFHGSVRDNLLLARPGASGADMIAAARAARAHDFIMALPQGYDTQLGDRGARLSGGERQRLSIARALLKNAPILVLDEATSYADAENEVLMQEAMAALCQGRTVLMIAHRLHTIMHADHIVVLDHGRIAGQGTHAALLRECPLYHQLWLDHEAARDWTLATALPQAEGGLQS